MQNSLLIKADNLSYKINESKLFSGISFALNNNEALHIIGSNGSGKSTLIRILGGISEPSKGNITKKEDLKISYLGHKNALKSYLSVRDNLDLLDLMDKEQIDNLLTKFNLMNKLDVTLGNLSFGQQKKIALLRIFINEADLILLDEPFVGLDTEMCEILSEHLNKKVEEGSGLIFTSHIASNIRANNFNLD
jgi:heme ABC exporter ATP-binding subunit CcmA